VDFLMGAVFLALMMIYYHVKPGWSFFLVPFFLGGMILLAFSVSMILAAMNVRYRDVKYALPFLIQIWLFVTPIIYPIAFLTPKMKRFLAFNPMAGFLEGFRSSLFNTGHMDWRLVGTSVIITIFLLIVGATYFRRTERSFADIV
jgi:lipopolysaccharide transport system permease protein